MATLNRIGQIAVVLLLILTLIPASSTSVVAQGIRGASSFRSDLDAFEIALPEGWKANSFLHSYVFYSSDLQYEMSELVRGTAINIIVYPNSHKLSATSWAAQISAGNGSWSVQPPGKGNSDSVLVVGADQAPIAAVVSGNDRAYLLTCESGDLSDCSSFLRTFSANLHLLAEFPIYVPSSVEVEDILKMPFDGQQHLPWKVVQGYRTGTHTGYEALSLDFVRDSANSYADTEKEAGLAPASGAIAWGSYPDEPQGCISIKTDIPELGGKDVVRTMVCHIVYDRDYRSDGSVQRGQRLGLTAPAGQKGNNGVPHLHITLYRLGESSENGVRLPIAFSGAGRLDGGANSNHDFTDDGTVGEWTGYSPIYSSNGASFSATVTDIADPDAYSCSQPGYIDFEGLPDGTNLSSGTISGVQFTTTGGYTWLVGDFATENYNGKYPAGAYMSHGTHWAWLGVNQGAGRIDFPKGPAAYFSVLVSNDTPVYLDAYDTYDSLLATAGPAPVSTNTGHMTELKITRAIADMAYVVVHDTGNYFEIDDVCTNAPQTPNTIKRLVQTTYPMQTGQSVSDNFIVDFIAGFRQLLHLVIGPFHSDVDVQLTRPDGSVVSQSDPGVTYTKTPTQVEVFIDNAKAGPWEYKILANQLEPGGENIRIVVDEQSFKQTRMYLPIVMRTSLINTNVSPVESPKAGPPARQTPPSNRTDPGCVELKCPTNR
jgi:hypothetical protein